MSRGHVFSDFARDTSHCRKCGQPFHAKRPTARCAFFRMRLLKAPDRASLSGIERSAYDLLTLPLPARPTTQEPKP
jgi:hypothetical protein